MCKEVKRSSASLVPRYFCLFCSGMISKSSLSALLIGISAVYCMPLILSISKGLLRSVLPSRLLGVVTMATESSTEAAADLSAAFTTIGNAEAAEKLAGELVKQKLAACVNIIPGVKSIYEWKGNIENDQELILMIKTRTSKVEALSEFIRKNHPYEVAELITFPIQNGNLPYLQWMQQNVPK